MRLKLFILLTLMAVLPVLAQQVGLYGVVVDAQSGQPVAGATVLLDVQGNTVTTGPKPADYDLGDVNRDKSVNSKDATEILKAYAAFSTGNTPRLTESQKLAADVNKDGSVNAKDASIVLAYYSYLSTGGKKSLTDYMTS